MKLKQKEKRKLFDKPNFSTGQAYFASSTCFKNSRLSRYV